MTLAQDNLEAYAVCYQKAVNRLSKVREEAAPLEIPADFLSPPDHHRRGLSERLRILQGPDSLVAGQAASFATVLPAFR